MHRRQVSILTNRTNARPLGIPTMRPIVTVTPLGQAIKVPLLILQQTKQNRHSSIMIDVDEHNESGQHEITLEEFLGYVCEKPEWLYKKLKLIHRCYEDVIDNHNAQLDDLEQIVQAKAQVVAAENSVALSRNAAEKLTVRSPYTGRVTEKLVNRFAFVNPGTPLTSNCGPVASFASRFGSSSMISTV